MMKPETLKAFATFRVVGDALDPDQITHFFRIIPTQAYAKGSSYVAGPRSGERIAKTGLWYLSTDKIVMSSNVLDHLAYIFQRFQIRRDSATGDVPQLIRNFTRFKKIMADKSLSAKVTCFWYGSAGSRRPSIPRSIIEIFHLIDVDIETDFDTDEPPVGAAAMAD